jgi:UDP-N-acetylglucosamine:LPS N-acetylglucosamine transferase
MVDLFTGSALESQIATHRGSPTKLLAVSSGGGHWVQLLRVAAAFQNCVVTFATTHASYRSQVTGHKFYTVNDSSRSNIFGLVKTAGQLAWIMWTEKPDIVISTGAAPGYLALRLARLINAKTIWLDSIANVDQLSLSGLRVGRYADLWLTQWPHLAKPNGPHYGGSVL